MKEIDVRGILYPDGERTVREIEGFPQKSNQCPPLGLFTESVREGWPGRYESHVNTCPYCQRTIGLAYRIECPHWTTLGKYLGLALDREAVEWHIHHDQCDRCRLRLLTPGLREYANELARPGSTPKSVEWWSEIWSKVRDALIPVLPPNPALLAAQTQHVKAKGDGIKFDPAHEPTSKTVPVEGGEAYIERTANQQSISIQGVTSELVQGVLVAPGIETPKQLRFRHGAALTKLSADDLRHVQGDSALVVLFPEPEDIQ